MSTRQNSINPPISHDKKKSALKIDEHKEDFKVESISCHLQFNIFFMSDDDDNNNNNFFHLLRCVQT